ncbi:MAG TPA: hypothetical protein H9671_05805 [Firmicutes bacterium]|nr:hypothetical protein [Bacillota bacterium]
MQIKNNGFRYRIAAIIENGCILLTGNKTAAYYDLDGGAVRMYETAEESVKGEVLKETGVSRFRQIPRPAIAPNPYEFDRLAVIHEKLLAGMVTL